ncbi:MAG TPA: hypothetical protein VJS12_14400 [Steroidobacteraceae bacterium]|nr:hypothetical protein [Steroidobacteraceae bacterium]
MFVTVKGSARTQAAFTAVLAMIALGACGHDRELPADSQVADGMAIYLGVMPAELIRGHSTALGDPPALHGAAPEAAGSHHVVVALFDAKTGARITDARIRADVGDRSYNHGPAKPLEPMQIAGTTTYGNFFPMQGQDAWRIHLTIERPHVAHVTEADFRYEHAVGH